MCLAVPGRVLDIRGVDELRAATVDFGGVQRDVSLAFVPEANTGDYVLVHVGFALAKIDEQSARETLEALQQIGQLDDTGPEPKRAPS
ncbi:MAG TPA: HypC/HybG/HupF family hydrogenase formation chaperone [Phycisphaerae bacterium]|nr:HypC/HybG/HupF family hydrogenase formation chaperone [Phycisphaerae bacterium]